MRNFLLVAGIAIVAIVLGMLLFLFGPKSLQSDVNNALLSGQIGTPKPPVYVVLEAGTDAISISDRTNYRIMRAQDLSALWPLVYGDRDAPPIPSVDFSKYEVLAIFDGTHSAGGFDVKITDISDANPVRTVVIDHITPGPTCGTQGPSSPFKIIQVPKTTFSLSHKDVTSASICAPN
jgi:hypothetical protein